METFFNYETAKMTLVMTGYMMLLLLDAWGLGYLIFSGFKWCKKKGNALIQKRKGAPSEKTEE